MDVPRGPTSHDSHPLYHYGLCMLLFLSPIGQDTQLKCIEIRLSMTVDLYIFCMHRNCISGRLIIVVIDHRVPSGQVA